MQINKSKTYILPLIALKWAKKEVLLVENTYLFHKDYINSILVVLSMSEDDEFVEFINNLYEHEDYIDSFIIDESRMCVVFTIRDVETLNCFIDGKYSKFQSAVKNKIVNYHTRINGRKFSNLIFEILHQSKRLRDSLELRLNVSLPPNAELTSIINKDDEEYGD